MIAPCLQAVSVVDQQPTCTGTSTIISSIMIAPCLHTMSVIDQKPTFPETFTKISSMMIAPCLHTVSILTKFSRGTRSGLEVD